MIHPTTLLFNKKESTLIIKLIVHGQGIFIFNNDYNEKCSFSIYDKYHENGLNIEFTQKSVLVNGTKSKEPFIDTTNNQGLINKKGAYYWFSLDSQNQKLYAGIGEARLINSIYEYQFEKTSENKSFLESLVKIYIDDTIKPLKLVRDPITTSIPLLIKDINQLTMEDIAKNTYLPTAFLTPMAQKLYNCIAGDKFILDTRDFPNFSKAIEYSIATPGCWCYERLQAKSREFNPDKPNLLETYLRITLGQNNGESPGIPYVMEIWPPQHYSPVHNHGDSSAVIRVLHGGINVSLFAFLCIEDDLEPCAKHDFVKDDITWISPALNQVHQLRNINEKETCITIQCYMYEDDNKKHYDYFDYLDDNKEKQQFEPDSDMEFIKFKELIKQEWFLKPTKSWFCC